MKTMKVLTDKIFQKYTWKQKHDYVCGCDTPFFYCPIERDKQPENIFGYKPGVSNLTVDRITTAHARLEGKPQAPNHIKARKTPVIYPDPGKNSAGGIQICILCTTQSLCKAFHECILSTETSLDNSVLIDTEKSESMSSNSR